MAQDESEQSKQADDRSRDRSPPFPFISLEKAIERVGKFEAHYKKSAGRVSNVLPLWDYTLKSSGGLQTIGALKAYGLLEDEGSGNERKVKLTDLALRILKEERLPKRQEAIKEAALKPKALAEHWALWGADRPPDAECRSELTLERGYTDDAANRLLRVYDDNLKYARLAFSDKGPDKQFDPLPPSPKIGDLIQWESGGVLKLSEPIRVTGIAETGDFLFVEGHLAGIPITEVSVVSQASESQSNLVAGQATVTGIGTALPAPIKSAPQGLRQDTFTLDEGMVVLQYPAKMSADSYEDFDGWIQLQLRKIKRGIEQ